MMAMCMAASQGRSLHLMPPHEDQDENLIPGANGQSRGDEEDEGYGDDTPPPRRERQWEDWANHHTSDAPAFIDRTGEEPG